MPAARSVTNNISIIRCKFVDCRIDCFGYERRLTWLRLVEQEGVGSILCLQQDSDMEYFKLDLGPILRRVEERGDVHHIRYRINDFDAFDLRMKLPEAAATVAREIGQGRKVYIHCTAGEFVTFHSFKE
jgi:hypothetical protein